MTIIIAGERSGVGKTTVTLTILATLISRSLSVQSFKVGPDYIDPMFHSKITGLACRNLDPILTSQDYVSECFKHHSTKTQYSLIEGVMGLFDGASGREHTASTAHIAKILNLPVVLVVNCASISRSVAAIVHGYSTFDPEIQIKGIILNKLATDRHLELITQALEPLRIPILGTFFRNDDFKIPDRYLGLTPTNELSSFNQTIDRLVELGKQSIDWDNLLPLLESPREKIRETVTQVPQVRIAVAKDDAFSFYYADNFDLLVKNGVELVFWSPLHDREIPINVQGFYFGGGFPEIFAAALADNLAIKMGLIQLIRSGMPTYAECGGLMYLCEQIVDFNDHKYPMLGLIPVDAIMGNKLTLGYREATALRNSCLVNQGDRIWGHEFHRSVLSNTNQLPLYDLKSYNSQFNSYQEGWQSYQIHASYVHLHFGNKPHLIMNFIRNCINYL